MESDDSDNDIRQEEQENFKPMLVLYLVDTHSNMFKLNNDNGSCFQSCLNSLLHVADSSLLLTPRSMKSPFGVFLATNEIEESKLIAFQKNMPECVQLLKNLTERIPEDLQISYERKGDVDFADLLLFCKHELDKLKIDAYKSTIVFITNDSDPSNQNSELKTKIENTVENLRQQNVFLKIITTNPDFDADLFYADLFGEIDFKPIEYVQCGEHLQELLATYLQIKVLKFSYNFYPFRGNVDKFIKVDSFSYINLNEISNNMWLTKKDHASVKKNYKCKIDEDDDVTVRNPEEKEMTPKIQMTKKEGYNLKLTNLPIGFTLLYTCEKLSNPHFIIKPSKIIQANKNETEKYFKYFWNSLVKSNLVMICLFKSRNEGKLYYVELETKMIDETKSFICKYLPNTENIASYSELIEQDIDPVSEEKMNSIVKNLSFDYSPLLLSDELHDKKIKYIKSQILEQEYVHEEEEGQLAKSRRQMSEIISEDATVLKEIFNKPKRGEKRKQ